MFRMITMRLKSGPAISSEWRCLFCLHVRTATIILGMWHLILHVLILSALAVIFRNHNLLDEGRVGSEYGETNIISDENTIEDLPTPLSKVDPSIPGRHHRDHGLYYNLDMAGLVTMFTLTFNLLLVYGAIKGKATPLLPFFCLQLFDFAVSTLYRLTATGYACYMRSMHRLVAETWQLPFRNYLLQLSPQCLSLVVLFAFVLSMVIKAYCIGIVWRCYKYLTLRQQALRSAIHYIMPGDIPTDRMPPMEPDYSSLLPDYEAACKQTPPPSYQAAVAAQAEILSTAVGATGVGESQTTTNIESNQETANAAAATLPISNVSHQTQAVITTTSATSPTFTNQITTVTIPQAVASGDYGVTDAVPPVEQQVK
ncbi:lysosomal-associated transmembrane protein 4A isoform X2 [Chrysoperla carnea]|uniref:lysosomal-associated transmembrane protein 4A isoform X2 n=1 Tax=Chrysoperla carnea TaxID=189513 RepID=UPI001D097F2C|nr:lysosomal-associated transmembrane protein 4A isoform X2 [Chrysoperla carnea]